MPVTDIKEIRIFPSLAIARFGSSPYPMDNYEVIVDEYDTLGHRKIEPAETLKVEISGNTHTARIVSREKPKNVEFRDSEGLIRPVAPFFEVWARFEDGGQLVQLTKKHLEELKLDSQKHLTWTVHVANWKAYRRTGDEKDKIEAKVSLNDHSVVDLKGKSDNFLQEKFIPLGRVVYLEPTEDFPGICLRFMPSQGKVYGPKNKESDPNIVEQVYSDKGPWNGHYDGDPKAPLPTEPEEIYRGTRLEEGTGERTVRYRSLGYLDDTCDGIIKVEIKVNNKKTVEAFARVTVGPPNFTPDSFHVRTVADELEQIAFGPEVRGTIEVDSVIDIIRRALETVRLMNTDYWNESGIARQFRRDPSDSDRIVPIFPSRKAAYQAACQRHASFLRALLGLKAPEGTIQRAAGMGALKFLVGILRGYKEVVEYDDRPRQRMPAMMRGSDGMLLALTRRQKDKIDKISQFKAPTPPSTNPQKKPSNPEKAMIDLVSLLSYAAFQHGWIQVLPDQPLSYLFSNPPEILNYLKTSGNPLDPRRKPLIKSGDPDNSEFMKLITGGIPHMKEIFSKIDQKTGKTGIEIVREWILSLSSPKK